MRLKTSLLTLASALLAAATSATAQVQVNRFFYAPWKMPGQYFNSYKIQVLGNISRERFLMIATVPSKTPTWKSNIDCVVYESNGTDRGTKALYTLFNRPCGTLSSSKLLHNEEFYVGMSGVSGSSQWGPPELGTNGAWVVGRTAARFLFAASDADNFTAAGTGSYASVYFTASIPKLGKELLVTGGTSATTRNVADIRAGENGSSPARLTYFQGTLYFVADDGVTGPELWRVSPITGAAELFKDFNKTPSKGSSITSMVAAGPLLYAAVDDGVKKSLWATTGVPAQTAIFKNLDAGHSNPDNLVAIGWSIFFTTKFGRWGSAVWESNGTADGTKVIRTFPYEIYKSVGLLDEQALVFQYFDRGPHPLVGVLNLGTKDVVGLGFGYYPTILGERMGWGSQIIGDKLFMLSPFNTWSGYKKEGGYFMYSVKDGLTLINKDTLPGDSLGVVTDAVVAVCPSVVLANSSHGYFYNMHNPACPKPPTESKPSKVIPTPIPPQLAAGTGAGAAGE